jgi:hypothetical protein
MKLNAVVLVDGDDKILGDFFHSLEIKTTELLNQFVTSEGLEFKNNVLHSDDIDAVSISEKIATVNSSQFLCFCYVHGDENSMAVDNQPFLSTSVNYYIFSNAFVYTFSCKNGAGLADKLIENQVRTFIGYQHEAWCPNDYDDITSNIALVGLKSFLSGKTAEDAYEDLRLAYDKQIYDKRKEGFARHYYKLNRDALVIKGDGKLTINDIYIADAGNDNGL